jgi:hypothetical protein
MDTNSHAFKVTSTPGGLLYECDAECGRRLAVDRRTGALTVIDRGDQYAQHNGSIGDVQLAPIAVNQP